MKELKDELLPIVEKLVDSYETTINNSNIKWFDDRKTAIKQLKNLKKLDREQIRNITDNPVDTYCKLIGKTRKSYNKEMIIKKYLNESINELKYGK